MVCGPKKARDVSYVQQKGMKWNEMENGHNVALLADDDGFFFLSSAAILWSEQKIEMKKE